MNRRSGASELPGEVLIFVRNDRPFHHPAPFNVERDRRRYGSYRRNGRVRKTISASQRVCHIVRVHYRHVGHEQRCGSRAGINLYDILRRRDNPKQTIGGNSRTVVVDLLGQVCRSDRTGVNVESYEHKRAMVVLAVVTHILALHESHVGPKRKRLIEAGSRTAATNLHIADETIEIRNF